MPFLLFLFLKIGNCVCSHRIHHNIEHRCYIPILIFVSCHICNGWKVCSNRTTSVPKSVPGLVLDKVRFVCSDLRCSTPNLCPMFYLELLLLYRQTDVSSSHKTMQPPCRAQLACHTKEEIDPARLRET